MVPAVRPGGVRAEARRDQRRRHDAVRLPHHQGDRAARPRRSVPFEAGAAADHRVPHRAEEAGARRRASSTRLKKKCEDRGARLNEEVLAAAADALKRGEAGRARDRRPRATARRRSAPARRCWCSPTAAPSARSAAAATRTTRSGRPAKRSPPASPRSLHYELNDDFAQENGLVCGGQMDVHIDPLEPDAAPLHHRRRPRRLASRRGSPPTPASASTSSTTARSSPTPSAFPTPTRSSSSRSPTGCTAPSSRRRPSSSS